jgi:hypothetical protein
MRCDVHGNVGVSVRQRGGGGLGGGGSRSTATFACATPQALTAAGGPFGLAAPSWRTDAATAVSRSSAAHELTAAGSRGGALRKRPQLQLCSIWVSHGGSSAAGNGRLSRTAPDSEHCGGAAWSGGRAEETHLLHRRRHHPVLGLLQKRAGRARPRERAGRA